MSVQKIKVFINKCIKRLSTLVFTSSQFTDWLYKRKQSRTAALNRMIMRESLCPLIAKKKNNNNNKKNVVIENLNKQSRMTKS